MNGFMTIIFISLMILFYKLLGKRVLELFGYEQVGESRIIIAGFLCVTFIQWMIGSICQLLHTSWNIYYWILLPIILLLFFCCIRKSIKDIYNIKKILWQHMKNYWFLYFMASAFTLFSITNLLAYFEMNYDDSYYLGAIVQNIGTDRLASLNYFNGSPIEFPLARILNTFEIGYGFWGTLFHIDITFFARGTMTLHNYLIVFFASHALLSCWYKNEKYTQYALAAYGILMIPAAFLMQRSILKMYDSWQFTTAMWYGGSIVRVAAVPILLTFTFDLFKKIQFKKILFIGLISCSMISFSTIAITYVALYAIVILSIYCIFRAFKNRENRKKMFLWIGLFIIGWSFIFIVSQMYGKAIIGSGKDISYSYKTYKEQVNYLLNLNLLLYAAILVSVIGLFIMKDKKYALIICFSLLLLVIFRFQLFDYLVLMTTFDESFSALRMMTSIQLLLLLLSGYCVLRLTQNVFTYHTYSLLVFSFLTAIIIFNIDHLDTYPRYSQRGGGVSKYGYSLEKVLKNKYLSPSVFSDIGDYMSSLPNSRYRLIAPYTVPYEEGTLIFYTGLNYSSHNVEVCTSDRVGCDNLEIEDKNSFVEFSLGNLSREQVNDALKKYKIEYLVTYKEDVVNKLQNENCELVLTSESLDNDKFYLLKINY